MPGNRSPEVVGDEVFERDEAERPRPSSGSCTNRGSIGGTLRRANSSFAGLRVAHPDREVERQPGDIGERVRGVDRERHEHREDLGARRSRRSCSRSASSRSAHVSMWMPASSSAGLTRSRNASAWRSCSSWAFALMSASTSCGGVPMLVGTARPVAMRRLRPATRTMKNSSRLLAKIARKLARSSSGTVGVLGELEHALVEGEPAQLAVEVAIRRQGAVIDARRPASTSSSSSVGGDRRVAERASRFHRPILPLRG